MKKIYLGVAIGERAFIVMESKKMGNTRNLVFMFTLTEVSARVTEEGKMSVIYQARLEKCMTDKKADMSRFVKYLYFRDVNIDTGYSGMQQDTRYPVFTTKEKCLEWLKG